MTTIYISQTIGGDTIAAPTEAAAKQHAKDAYDIDGGTYQVMKVELAKLGTRELLCALYNNEPDKFVGTKEVTYTAPAKRGRKGKAEADAEEAVGKEDPEQDAKEEANAEEDYSDI